MSLQEGGGQMNYRGNGVLLGGKDMLRMGICGVEKDLINAAPHAS